MVIKVRVLSRTNQPPIGTTTGISDFISTAGRTGVGVVNDSIGRELRNEPNNAFVIGGKVRSFYEETNEGNITPFWGWDSDGELIESSWDGVDWEVGLDFRKINLALVTPVTLGLTGGSHGQVWEGELRAALGGFDTFKNFVLSANNTDTVLKRYLRDTLQASIKWVEAENDEQMGTASNVVAGLDGAINAANTRDQKTIFNWINSYASDFYGKQYLVAIPFVCYDTEPDTEQLIWSDNPSTEGGWTDQTDVLGITQPSFESDMFKDEQNKWQAMLRWPDTTGLTGINLDKLNQADYLNSSDYVWLKASLDAKWVTGNPVTGESDDVASALLTLSAPVIAKTTGIIDSHAGIPMMNVKRGSGEEIRPGAITGANSSLGGRSVTAQAMAKRALKPSAAGIPLISNTQTYGPWYKISTLDANGIPLPGNVHAEVDDGLTPWEYGGTGYMHLAGLAKVSTAVTAMQFAERGEVTVPGYPTRGLGASLTQPLTLYPSRTLSVGTITIGALTYTYNYIATVPSTVGANISNINTNVGPGGVTTTYSLSTYTPVFGRFAKGNAERIKQIGDNKVRTARNLRAQTALKQMLNTATARGTASADISRDTGKGSMDPKSPGILLAGKYTNGDMKRKQVISADLTSLSYYEDYDHTAMVSLDSAYRPVETTGSIGAAEYLNPDTNMPMISYAGNIVDQDSLDWLTPTGATVTNACPPTVGAIEAGYAINRAWPANCLSFPTRAAGDDAFKKASYTGSSTPHINLKTLFYLSDANNNSPFLDYHEATSGHDIESIAKGTFTDITGAPYNNGIANIFVGGISGRYASAEEGYRFLSLRGPLMLQSWGYDTQGYPIPNQFGDEGNDFTETTTATGTKFKEDWLSKPSQWPAAPVDLRYDRQRGVWVSPPAYSLELAVSATGIGAGMPFGSSSSVGCAAFGTGVAQFLAGTNQFGSSGGFIDIRNPFGAIGKNEPFFVLYDAARAEYFCMGGGGGGEGGGLEVRESGSCGYTGDCLSVPSITTFTAIDKMTFRKGLDLSVDPDGGVFVDAEFTVFNQNCSGESPQSDPYLADGCANVTAIGAGKGLRFETWETGNPPQQYLDDDGDPCVASLVWAPGIANNDQQITGDMSHFGSTCVDTGIACITFGSGLNVGVSQQSGSNNTGCNTLVITADASIAHIGTTGACDEDKAGGLELKNQKELMFEGFKATRSGPDDSRTTVYAPKIAFSNVPSGTGVGVSQCGDGSGSGTDGCVPWECLTFDGFCMTSGDGCNFTVSTSGLGGGGSGNSTVSWQECWNAGATGSGYQDSGCHTFSCINFNGFSVSPNLGRSGVDEVGAFTVHAPTIANVDCSGAITGISGTQIFGESFNNLIFGQGLSVSRDTTATTTHSGCSYLIESNMQIGTTGGQCSPFSALTFGSGFTLTQGTDCGGLNSCGSWTVHNTGISVASGAGGSGSGLIAFQGCSGSGPSGCSSFNCISFSGFAVEDSGSMAFTIAAPRIGSTGASCEPFSCLSFGSGFKLDGDNCTYTVHSTGGGGGGAGDPNGPRQISSLGTGLCPEDGGGGFGCTGLGCIQFSGFEVVQSGSSANYTVKRALNFEHIIEDVGAECAGSEDHEVTWKIALGAGLVDAGTYGDCHTLIKKKLKLGTNSNESIEEITFNHAGCAGEWAVPTTASSCGGVADLELQGLTKTIEVVTAVCCSGDTLTVDYETLTFCDGLLKTAAVTDGDCPC
jgi:hypothetical protein